MRIVLLGANSSGKTTYLAALFNLLYNRFYRGFTTTASKEDKVTYDYYRFVRQAYIDDPFPKSTQATTELNLSIQNQNFSLDVVLCDYRGGSIVDVATRKEPEKNALLEKNINTADIAIIFIDALQLIHYENIAEAKLKLGIEDIIQILMSIRQKKGKMPRLICALTKTDSDLIQEEDITICKSKVKEFFRDTCISTECQGMGIFDIGTIGKSLVKTSVKNEKKYELRNVVIRNSEMKYEPYNIASLLAKAIILYYDNMKEMINRKQMELSIEENKVSTTFKKIVDNVFKKSVQRRKVEKTKRELQEYKKEYESYKLCEATLYEIINNRE